MKKSTGKRLFAFLISIVLTVGGLGAGGVGVYAAEGAETGSQAGDIDLTADEVEAASEYITADPEMSGEEITVSGDNIIDAGDADADIAGDKEDLSVSGDEADSEGDDMEDLSVSENAADADENEITPEGSGGFDKNAANTMFGTSRMASPREPISNDDAWQGSYVWYGKWSGRPGNKFDPVPLKYRVLDKESRGIFTENDRTALLDCDYTLFATSLFYGKSSYAAGLGDYLNGEGFLNNDVFTVPESNAIVKSYKAKPDQDDGFSGMDEAKPYSFEPLKGCKIFLLDLREATRPSYGYRQKFNIYGGTSPIRNRIKNHYNGSLRPGWWLRSSFYDKTMKCFDGGCVYNEAGSISPRDVKEENDVNVSPAFNVNLANVLFSTAVEGPKGEWNTEYKFTLKDSDMTLSILSRPTVRGRNIIFPYSITGSNASKAEAVTVLILDKQFTAGNTNNANIIYYDKMSVSGSLTSGVADFDLPASLDISGWGSGYFVYFFAEDINGEHETDYASAPRTLRYDELNIFNYPVITFDPQGGSVTPASVMTGANGRIASLPVPKRSGYRFDGWSEDGTQSGIISSDTQFTSDTTVYALWSEDKHSITVNGGTANPGTASKGATVAIAAGAKTNHTFKNWTVVSGDVTIRDSNSASTTFVMGERDVTIRANYTFNGTMIDDIFVTVTEPANFASPASAVSEADKYTVTETKWIDTASEKVLGAADSFEKGKTYKVRISLKCSGGNTIFNTSPTGYINDSSEGVTVAQSGEGSATIEKSFTAKESTSDTTYTVYFDANGGSGTMAPVTSMKGYAVILPECTFIPPSEGMKFKQWDVGMPGDFASAGGKNFRAKAIWKDTAASFNVKFDNTGSDPYAGLNKITDGSGNVRYETVYTGGAVKPAVIVTGRDGILLKEGVDYTLKYSNNKNVDKKGKPAKVTVKGKGNYKGQKILKYYLIPADLAELQSRDKLIIPDQYVKSGSAPAPEIYYGAYKLKAGDLKYSKAKLKTDTNLDISGKGNFTGTLANVEFRVLDKNGIKANTIKIKIKAEKHVYNGSDQTLKLTTEALPGELTVTDGSEKKILGTGDFDLSYKNNRNAGTATVIVKGKGTYRGSASATFKIRAYSGAAVNVNLASSDTIYFDPAGSKPGLTVTANPGGVFVTLDEGIDYTVSYTNNKAAGRGKYTVKLKGNYKGHKEVTGRFTIEKAGFYPNVSVTVSDMTYKKKGKYYSMALVAYKNRLLKENKDYTVKYYTDYDCTVPLPAKFRLTGDGAVIYAKVKGKGNYESTEYIKPYVIQKLTATRKIDLSKTRVVDKNTGKAIAAQLYTGKAVCPAIKVQYKEGKTWKDVDESQYEYKYFNNVHKGRATILVDGVGSEVAGSKTAGFSIGKRSFGLFNWL